MKIDFIDSTIYLHSEKLVHNVQFGIINITEYCYHANRLPIYDLDTLHYASNTKQVSTYVHGHSMAMGNLNKSKETKPTTNTALTHNI